MPNGVNGRKAREGAGEVRLTLTIIMNVARPVVRCFIYFYLNDIQNNCKILLLWQMPVFQMMPVFRWRIWGTEKINKLSKVLWLVAEHRLFSPKAWIFGNISKIVSPRTTGLLFPPCYFRTCSLSRSILYFCLFLLTIPSNSITSSWRNCCLKHPTLCPRILKKAAWVSSSIPARTLWRGHSTVSGNSTGFLNEFAPKTTLLSSFPLPSNFTHHLFTPLIRSPHLVFHELLLFLLTKSTSLPTHISTHPAFPSALA